MVQHKCINCALPKANSGICPIFNIDPKGHTGCPKFTTELFPCSFCGGAIIGTVFLEQHNGNTYRTCEQCNQAFAQNMCQFCQSGDYCAFQQDTSCKLPPVITQQFKQGNAVVQTQIKNPERVAATCKKSCKCFNEELQFCMREAGGCSNHEIKFITI